MYSILEYRQKNSDYELVDVRHSSKPRTRGLHIACRACHSMKVKCSGHRDGCSRCKERSIPCTYVHSKRATRNSRATAPSIELSQPSTSHEAIPPLPDLFTLTDVPFDNELQNMWILDSCTEANARQGVSSEKQQATGEQPSQEGNIGKRSEPVRSGSAQAAPREITSLARFDKNRNVATGGNPSALCARRQSKGELSGMAGRPDQIQPTDSQHLNPIHDYDFTTILSVSDVLLDEIDQQICSTDIQELSGAAMIHSTDTFNNSQRLESQNLLSPLTTRPNSGSTCSGSCADRAFEVLGDLQVCESKSAPTAFDNHLNSMKHSLDRGFDVMGCLDCVKSTAVTTLLTAICERLVISFENWARQYHDRSALRTGKHLAARSQESLRTVFFGAYEISMGDEQCSILRALAMVQLRRLTRLLGRMGDVAVRQAWTDRKAALDLLLSRTEEAASGLIGRF